VEIKSTLLTKISNWLPPLASISLSLFLTILTITLARMVIENDNRLFYGVAGEIRPWFLLVWVFMLISFNMVAACIQRWRRRENSVAFRVYYTFLTFAALFCVTALGYLGMITSVF
jgi:small-conductance mechanosensitive channel